MSSPHARLTACILAMLAASCRTDQPRTAADPQPPKTRDPQTRDPRPSAFDAFCGAFTQASARMTSNTNDDRLQIRATAVREFLVEAADARRNLEAKYRHTAALRSTLSTLGGASPSRQVELLEWDAREQTGDFKWTCRAFREHWARYTGEAALTKSCAAKDALACNLLKFAKQEQVENEKLRHERERECGAQDITADRLPACVNLYSFLLWVVRDMPSALRVAERLCSAQAKSCREVIRLRLHLGDSVGAAAMWNRTCGAREQHDSDACRWPRYWLGHGSRPAEDAPSNLKP